MKTVALSLLFLVSNISFAGIINSNYEERHQKLIEQAITAQCGRMKDLTEVSTRQQVIRVDSGIRDINYVTVLTAVQSIDQSILDYYKIIAKSSRSDMYDHTTGNWGAYSVESVTCFQE